MEISRVMNSENLGCPEKHCMLTFPLGRMSTSNGPEKRSDVDRPDPLGRMSTSNGPEKRSDVDRPDPLGRSSTSDSPEKRGKVHHLICRIRASNGP